ncbi:hypothetical protein L1987_23181 [Smallanthus sonchifolius]|uniref:Uncharacterized protein n=1 Tax=Smallanthus sonchifolius TaxID=185202 RepID=A0ACB9IIE2_9ASTR|nr:hypothetical protein L1987_23181 [Smallanthus sonchifolius]
MRNKPNLDPMLEVMVPDDADYDAIQWYDLSAKRPRVEDPFDIDRFIGEVPVPSIPNSNPMLQTINGEPSRPCPFPDLNSQLLGTPSEGSRNSISGEHIPESCKQLKSCEGNRKNQMYTEVEATINMGKELGVNLVNMEEMVRTVIAGEMETDMVQ